VQNNTGNGEVWGGGPEGGADLDLKKKKRGEKAFGGLLRHNDFRKGKNLSSARRGNLFRKTQGQGLRALIGFSFSSRLGPFKQIG